MNSIKDLQKIESDILNTLNNNSLTLEEKWNKLNIIEFIEKSEIYQAELIAQNTELLNQEKIILNSQNEFAHLFNNAPIAYFQFDKYFKIQKYNKAAQSLLKHTNLLKENKLFISFINKKHLDKFFKVIFSVEKEGSATINIDLFEGPALLNVRLDMNFILTDEKPHYLVSIIDLTEELSREKELSDKTKKLYQKELEKIENYEKTIISMVDLIEQRDFYTGGHSQRVSSYSVKIAKELKLSSYELFIIKQVGMLHDIGKIAIPDAILLNPKNLSDQEHELIQQHVVAGYNIISKIPMFKDFSNIILYHHERYDGTGYPEGLKGDEIPLMASILAVADSFDAMTTTRIYHARNSVEEALEEIARNSGILFNPRVVKAALKVLDDTEIPKYKVQLPETKMEEERFAYFYKDLLTGLYNKDYLELKLQEKKYKHFYVIYLNNFSEYNKLNGWESGNVFLNKFSKLLFKNFPQSLAFRVNGDDFVLLFKKENPQLEEKIMQSNLIKNSKINIKIVHEQNIKELKDYIFS